MAALRKIRAFGRSVFFRRRKGQTKGRVQAQATGILGDTSKPRHLNAREIEVLAKARQIGKRENLSRVEQQTLEEADRIRISQTMGEKVKKARREIKDYVVVSRHPIPVKIANLRADLKKTNHPEVKVALENAIAELENFGKTTRK